MARVLPRAVITALTLAVCTMLPLSTTAVAQPIQTSQDIGGYLLPHPQSQALLHTDVTVPTLSCDPTFRVMQAEVRMEGTASAIAGSVVMSCSQGYASYQPQIYINGNSYWTPFTVKPGDIVNVDVSMSQVGEAVSIRDSNSRQRMLMGGPPDTSQGEALVIGTWRCPGGYWQVPMFTGLHFRNSTVQGAVFGTLAPTAVQLLDSNYALSVIPGALNRVGKDFQLIWHGY